MLGLIIRKEILSNILSLRFGVTFLLFIVLIFTSIYVTANEHEMEVSRYGSRVRMYNDNLTDILSEKEDWGERGRLERLFWQEGKSTAIPVSELAWLGEGLQSILPAGITVTQNRYQNTDRAPIQNPLIGLLPTPDYMYMVNVVLSLLAILFMFDAVCGEKEMGTLRLMLSNSVPRYEVLLGKWIGGFIVLLIPFLIATAGGMVYAWAIGVLQPEADNLMRIGVMVFLAGCYIAVFFNLSLFVSATTHNSATSLLICLLLWVVCILAVPNMAPVTAKILEPIPSREKIETEKENVRTEIRLQLYRLEATSGALRYGDEMERKREKLENKRERELKKWDRYYEGARKTQYDLAQTLGRVSPSANWVYAATALANTGPDIYHELEKAAETAAETFDVYVHDFWDRDREGDEQINIEPEEIPSVKLITPDVGAVITRSLPGILLLLGLNVLFFMLAFTFFIKYDVR